jgi:hypothetical protein
VLAGFSKLPDAVVSKLLEVEVSSFLGLLPEINRCFVTFDNVLLLWNYNNAGDFAWYRGLDQPIRTVALVVPVPGVFEDIVKVRSVTAAVRLPLHGDADCTSLASCNCCGLFLTTPLALTDPHSHSPLQYILVVVTPVQVFLLALTFADDDVNKAVTIVPTGISCSTDGVGIVHVVGTKQGRIFLGGEDGCLYELGYHHSESTGGLWAALMGDRPAKARKTNHTASVAVIALQALIGTRFLSPGLPLVRLAIDHDRSLLYTLSVEGEIKVRLSRCAVPRRWDRKWGGPFGTLHCDHARTCLLCPRFAGVQDHTPSLALCSVFAETVRLHLVRACVVVGWWSVGGCSTWMCFRLTCLPELHRCLFHSMLRSSNIHAEAITYIGRRSGNHPAAFLFKVPRCAVHNCPC